MMRINGVKAGAGMATGLGGEAGGGGSAGAGRSLTGQTDAKPAAERLAQLSKAFAFAWPEVGGGLGQQPQGFARLWPLQWRTRSAVASGTWWPRAQRAGRCPAYGTCPRGAYEYSHGHTSSPCPCSGAAACKGGAAAAATLHYSRLAARPLCRPAIIVLLATWGRLATVGRDTIAAAA